VILLIPTRKIDLTGLSQWFIRIYVVAYAIAFAAMLATFGYLIAQLVP
jgi:hypothetical protein